MNRPYNDRFRQDRHDRTRRFEEDYDTYHRGINRSEQFDKNERFEKIERYDKHERYDRSTRYDKNERTSKEDVYNKSSSDIQQQDDSKIKQLKNNVSELEQKLEKEMKTNVQTMKENLQLRIQLQEKHDELIEKQNTKNQIEMQMNYQNENVSKVMLEFEKEQLKSSHLEKVLASRESDTKKELEKQKESLETKFKIEHEINRLKIAQLNVQFKKNKESHGFQLKQALEKVSISSTEKEVLKKEIDSLRIEISTLKSHKTDIERQNNKQTVKIEKLNQFIKENTVLNSLTSEKDDKIKQSDDILQHKIQDTEPTDQTSTENDIDFTKNLKILQLEDENQKLRQQQIHLEKSLKTNQSEHSNCEQQILDLQLKIKELDSKQCAKQNLSLEDLINLEDISKSVEDLKSKIIQLEDQKSTNLNQLQEYKSKFDHQEIKIRDLLVDNRQQEKKIKNSEAKIKALEQRINDLKLEAVDNEQEMKNQIAKSQSLVQDKINAQLKNYSLNEKINSLETEIVNLNGKFAQGESKIKESAQKYESQSAELYKSKQSLLETSQIIDLLIEMETNGNVILTESNLVESNLCFEMKLAEKINSIKDKESHIKRIKEITLKQYENLKDLFFNLRFGLNELKKDRDQLIEKSKRDRQVKASVCSVRDLDKLSFNLKQETDKNKALENQISDLRKTIACSSQKDLELKQIKDYLDAIKHNVKNIINKFNLKYEREYDLNFYIKDICKFIDELFERLNAQKSDYNLSVNNFKQKESNFLDEIKTLRNLNQMLTIENEEIVFNLEKLRHSNRNSEFQNRSQEDSINKRKVIHRENSDLVDPKQKKCF